MINLSSVKRLAVSLFGVQRPRAERAEVDKQGSRGVRRPSADYVAREIDLAISTVLRLGITVSVVTLLIGTLAFLVALYAGGQPGTVDQLLHAQGAVLTGPGQVVEGLRAGSPLALQYLGLVVLMVLPLVPIALSLYGYLLQRDRVFVAITTFLLGVLSIGFVLSIL